MQSSLNEEKQKIKSFFEENGINFDENENHLKIKGEMFYADILNYVEISVKVGTDKYLTITYDFEKNTGELVLTYEITFPEQIKKELKIKKDQVQAIYYYDNKLVILF
jgi:hypothetical protein